MKIIIRFFLLLIFFISTNSLISAQPISKTIKIPGYGKNYTGGFFDKDWQTIIDTTWGPGLPTSWKLEIFDSVWNMVDHQYACFQNLNLDWNEIRNIYRPEIENGVSQGRFAAILNQMGIKLNEFHTLFMNSEVNILTKLSKGTPLIFNEGWGLDTNFCAGLSPLPDSSLLVYCATSDHPLGLEPGDIVLGYEGYLWKDLYKILLTMEFPFWYQSRSGSNDKAFAHIWLSGAGNNWRLFDTIDIKKYSGEIVHLPTSLMENYHGRIKYSYQLPVRGVSIDTAKYHMTWGIIEGTNIGYVYSFSWLNSNTSTNFYNALDSLINIYHINGLIIDLRANAGGYFQNTDLGLNLLFNADAPDLGMAERDNPFDHYSMKIYSMYYFDSDSTHYFNKPIAVLSSPYAISAADFLIERLKSHPYVKVFGETSSSAFASSEHFQMANCSFDIARLNGFSEENPDEYLTHKEVDVDYKVSFTPDDVRKGDDTVVKTAINWINNSINNIDDGMISVNKFLLYQNYPNPFNPETKIKYSVPQPSQVQIKIFDVLGNEIQILVNEVKPSGTYELTWNAINKPCGVSSGGGYASGVYFYQLRALPIGRQSGTYIQTKKMILLK